MKIIFTLLLGVLLGEVCAQKDSLLDVRIEQYSKLLEEDPTNDNIRYLRGLAYVEQRQHYYAQLDFNAVIANNSKYFYAFRNEDGALVDFNKPDLGLEDSSTAIILKPFQSYYFTDPAYDLLYEERFDEVIDLCNKALLLDSNNTDAYEYRGSASFFKGEYEACIPDFEWLVAEDSTNAYFNNNLGSALTNVGRTEEALPCYYLVLRYEPSFEGVYFNLGNTYYYLFEADSAIKYLDKAVAYDSLRAENFSARGNSYSYKGKSEMALLDYNRALALDSTEYRYWGNRGMLYEYMGRYDEALADLNKAIEHDPERYYEYYNYRAKVYVAQEKYELALADYQKAQAMNSDLVSNEGSIGWVYYLMEEYKNCIRYSELAIERDATAYYAAYNKAISLLCLGDKEASLELYMQLKDEASAAAKEGAKQDLRDLRKSKRTLRKEVRRIVKRCF